LKIRYDFGGTKDELRRIKEVNLEAGKDDFPKFTFESTCCGKTLIQMT